MAESPPKVTIYSDGGCSPNPGPGGWAAVILQPGRRPRELSGSQKTATNNRMELQAAIEALKALPRPCQVEFFTDSVYLRDGITLWLSNWQRKGWKLSNKGSVKNQDLWKALAALVDSHQINWRWTKGHAGDKWNERVDHLARAAIPKPPLPVQEREAIHVFLAASYLGRGMGGGWGAVLRDGDRVEELSGHADSIPPNGLHVLAAFKSLSAVKKAARLHVYTTSSYLSDGATRWLANWQARHWKTIKGTAVKNRAQWEQLAGVIGRYSLEWHTISSDKLPKDMRRAKLLANQAARK